MTEELLWARYAPLDLILVARLALAAGAGAAFGGASSWLTDLVARLPRSHVFSGTALFATLTLAGWSVVREADSFAVLAMLSLVSAVILVGIRWRDRDGAPLLQSKRTAPAGVLVLLGVAMVFVTSHLEYSATRADNAALFVRFGLVCWTAWGVAAYLALARTPLPVTTREWPAMALIAGTAAGAAMLPFWEFGLMVPLKLCALGFGTLTALLAARSLQVEHRVWRAVTLLIAIAGFSGLGTLAAAPVPARFGPTTSYALAGGLVSSVTSATLDDDGDFYFSAASGGLDPDDTDHAVRPTSVLDWPPAPPVEVDVPPVRHVVVFVVDALRADLLHRPSPETTPFLAAHAGEFVRFQRAYAPGNTTNISLPLMLDGTAPQAPGADDRSLFDSLPPSVDAHFAIFTDLAGEWHGRSFGVPEEDFSWSSDPDERGFFAGPAVRWIVERLDDHGARGGAPLREAQTVSVIYLSDPHAPYVCPDGTHGGFDCYLAEVQQVDAQLASFFSMLEERDLLKMTAVILTADHGEEFGEHGFHHHSGNLFEAQVRVPFWVRIPELTAVTVDTPVSLGGLAATVRDALGLEPVPTWRYPSLLPLAADVRSTYPVPVVHHWEDANHDVNVAVHQSAFIEADAKLIVDWRTGRRTLYDPSRSDQLIDDAAMLDALTRRHLPELVPK